MVASEVELLEVFRLGEAAGESEIVRRVGDRLAGQWLGVSRFREVETLTSRSLRVQSSPDTLLWAGRAQRATGNLMSALGYYEQALPIYREVGDRAGEAATLNNIGMVHDSRGERQAALDYYEQALPNYREVGNRAGEATTLNNIGGVHDSRGDWEAALGYYEQALPIRREVGDRAGEAVTLNNIGMVHDSRGDWQAALGYYQQALPIFREVGDRASEAVTRYNIAMVHRGAGRLVEAVAELELVVALDAAVQHPDLQTDTAMLEQVRGELHQRRSGGDKDAERGE